MRHSSEAFSDLHIMLLFSENMSQTYFLFPGIFFIPLSDRQKTRIVFYKKGYFMTMLEALYRDYRDELICWCSTMTQDRSTAEDLVQEAFWKAMNHEAMLQTMSVSQCRAWLYQVVKNLFIDRTRHAVYEAVMDELPETADDEFFLPHTILLSAQELLRRLPEDERVLFVLRYIEGYNSTELGKLFSLSPGAVRAKLFSARQHLKKELED